MQAIPQPVLGGTICENAIALYTKMWKYRDINQREKKGKNKKYFKVSHL
jgi:hypothetical protein